MSAAGRICVRPLADLIQENSNASDLLQQPNVLVDPESSPVKRKNTRKKAATTGKKAKEEITTVSTVKKSQTSRKLGKTDERQKTIDSFFKSASKNYHIEPSKEIRSPKKQVTKKSRRRIVYNDRSETTTVSNESKYQERKNMKKTKIKPTDIIDLCDLSDSDEEKNKSVVKKTKSKMKKSNRKILSSSGSEQSENGDITIQPQDEGEETNNNMKTRKVKTNNKQFKHKKQPNDNKKSCTKSTSEENEPLSVIKSKAIKNTTKAAPHSSNDNLQETESIHDDFVPASQKKDAISTRTQRRSFKLKKSNNTDALTPPLSSLETGDKPSMAAVTSVMQTNVHAPIVSIFENSPPTTSTSRTNTTPCNAIIKSIDKENFVPETQPPNCCSVLVRETTEFACSTINEKTNLSTEINVEVEEVIVDILDDNFEYNQRATGVRSVKTTTTNSTSARKTRSSVQANETPAKKAKKSRPLPAYKVIEGTNGIMAVDAFCFGDIEGVSHYFLTHFHADHYIGLTRKFSHNLYMSSITARLVRTFIPIEEKYIKEMQLNTPIMIDGIQVTAIDANHCPGAVLLVFKLPDGRCILHTGDFRASADMESDPIFWNNDIDLIYLDTTYIHQKQSFVHQYESVELAGRLMQEFLEKNVGERILFVCGSYLIGKEKFWSALAKHFNLKVFAEGNRKKSLTALEDETLNELLIDNAVEAQMHVLPLQKINYHALLEYLDKYAEYFDLIFALRPSGWEKNRKPQYRGKINIIGIEYSEHSSRGELQRFVQYLKPKNVISTVPVNGDAMITAKVPKQWYQYTTLKRQYQPTIMNFFKTKHTTLLLTDKSDSRNVEVETLPNEKNELFMMVSPESEANETIGDRNSNYKLATISPVKQPTQTLVPNLKPKEEVLAKVPIVNKPITVDCDTDDDWLT